MATYTELYYHFVWTTKGRQEWITAEMEPHLYRYIRFRSDRDRVLVHALNGMPDQVHLACTLPTELSIARFLESIKGASSHFINHLPDHDWQLYWQPGYGALTFSRRDLARIVAYIDGQKEHHREGKLSAYMERVGP